ncbi:MAG: amino acid ABC transporter substrate-binding protein [Planctomycetota bacterium]|nr:amino acid ABC transporter substrate-binding protein [Planctomycetota bacterium]
MRVTLTKIVPLCALALLSAVLLTACGGGKDPAKTDGGKTGEASAKDESLERVKKAGVLKWGVDAGGGGGPYVYLETDAKTQKEKVVGWEVEVMDKLVAHMGVKYEIAQVEWGKLIPDLVDGKRSDMILNGLEINEDRKKVLEFSSPYCVYAQQLTVRVEDKDTYKSLDDLKGKKIGVLGGTEANNVLKKAGFTEDQIVPFDDSNTPYMGLKDKRVDAVLQEDMIADFYAGKDEKLFNVPKTFAPGKYAVAFRKEDKALKAEIERVLQVMKDNGELAEIYKKWHIWNDLQKDIGVKEAEPKK